MRRRWIVLIGCVVVAAAFVIAVRLVTALRGPAAPATEPAIPMHGADAYGDPLPEGAVARLGTIRYRTHAGAVWHPDGTHLLTSNARGQIVAMDAETGLPDWTLPGHVPRYSYPVELRNLWNVLRAGKVETHADQLLGMLIAPRRRRLVTYGYSIRVWDLDDRVETARIGYRGGNVWGASLSPAARYMTTSWSKYVRVFDLDVGRELKRWTLPADVHRTAWLDDERVVALLDDGRVFVARFPRFADIEQLPAVGEAVTDLVAPRGADRLWVQTRTGAVLVLGLGEENPEWVEVEGRVEDVDPAQPIWGKLWSSPDGRVVTTSAFRRVVREFHGGAKGTVTQVLRTAPSGIGYGWNADGSHFAWGSFAAVRVTDSGVARPVREDGPFAPEVAVAFRPDGLTLLTADGSRAVIEWDLATMRGRRIGTLPERASVRRRGGNGIGAELFAPRERSELDLETGDVRWSVETTSEGPRRFARTVADGRSVAWMDERCALRIEPVGGSDLAAITVPAPSGEEDWTADTPAVSEDRRRAAVVVRSSTDRGKRRLRFFDLGEGTILGEIEHMGDAPFVFSADGRFFAAGVDPFSDGGRVHVWDLDAEPLREVLAFDPHRVERAGWVTSHSALMAAFSPDGKMFAFGGGDGVLSIADLATTKVTRIRGHVGAIYCVSWSPDSRLVATGGDDTTVLVWDVAAVTR